jgi:hypothetical protein
MASHGASIARIRLARSPMRLFLLPVVLLLVGIALVAGAVAGPPRAGELAWFALVVGGAVLVVVGLGLAAWLSSIGLDVEEAAVRVHWLGGGRRYALAPGPVTRVRLRGEQASRLRVRRGWLGWGLGPATLRDEERIHLVRLASSSTLILVPTDDGRLAIAAASEDELLDALSLAARARQRSEELAQSAPEPDTELDTGGDGSTAPEPEPHVLTGIERMLLEEQQARERAEALAASTAVAVEPPPVAQVPGTDDRGEDVDEADGQIRGGRWRLGRRATERIGRARTRIGRPRPSAALLLLPLIGAGIVWGAAAMLGRLPEPTSDLGRLTSLALVLAGPATAVGAIMARAWWPRLVGVVVTSGLAAAVFIGRALLG